MSQSFLDTTQTHFRCSSLAFAFAFAFEPLPGALGAPVSWCLCVSTSTYLCHVHSFSTCLASLIFVPAIVSLMCLVSTAVALCNCQHSADVLLVVVTVDDRLWRDIFRFGTECLAVPSVLSTSSGSQAMADHGRDNPLIVSCSISCELSDPCGSLETFLTHLRHTLRTASRSASCIEHFCESRRSRASTKPLAQPGPSPCAIPCRVFTHHHFGSSGSVCCKHCVQHLFVH